MKKKEPLTVHDCLIHDGNPSFDVDPIIEQHRREMGKKLDAVICAKATELGVSPGELLERFKPTVDFSIDNEGGETYYVNIKIGWEPRLPKVFI